jgi:hypothetical protein
MAECTRSAVSTDQALSRSLRVKRAALLPACAAHKRGERAAELVFLPAIGR